MKWRFLPKILGKFEYIKPKFVYVDKLVTPPPPTQKSVDIWQIPPPPSSVCSLCMAPKAKFWKGWVNFFRGNSGYYCIFITKYFRITSEGGSSPQWVDFQSGGGARPSMHTYANYIRWTARISIGGSVGGNRKFLVGGWHWTFWVLRKNPPINSRMPEM